MEVVEGRNNIGESILHHQDLTASSGELGLEESRDCASSVLGPFHFQVLFFFFCFEKSKRRSPILTVLTHMTKGYMYIYIKHL